MDTAFHWDQPLYSTSVLSWTRHSIGTNLCILPLCCHGHGIPLGPTSVFYLCVVMDTAFHGDQPLYSTSVLSWTRHSIGTNLCILPLCCHGHGIPWGPTSVFYLCVVMDTAFYGDQPLYSTSVLSWTRHSMGTNLCILPLGCHGHGIPWGLTSVFYLCVVMETGFHGDQPLYSTSVLSWTRHSLGTNLCILPLCCHGHGILWGPTSVFYLCVVMDTAFLGDQPLYSTSVLSWTRHSMGTNLCILPLCCHGHGIPWGPTSVFYLCVVMDTAFHGDQPLYSTSVLSWRQDFMGSLYILAPCCHGHLLLSIPD